jgi:hypothetical protein
MQSERQWFSTNRGQDQIVLGHGPLERHALAGPFLLRLAKGVDRLCERLRSALTLAKAPKRKTEIVLRPGPIEGRALAGAFLQRLAKGVDRLRERLRPALPLAEATNFTVS